MNTENLVHASKMWADGVKAEEIAASIGMTRKGFYSVCDGNRDLFPLRRRPSVVTDEMLLKLSEMWMSKHRQESICRAGGMCRDAFRKIVRGHPGLFPARSVAGGHITFAPTATQAKRGHKNRMRWTTEAGAVVTLPRVSFISCPRSA